MTNSAVALLNACLGEVGANVSAVGSYFLGVIVLVVPLSVFPEVWSFLETTPPERLSPFSAALLLISYGIILMVMSASERNPHDPSKRAPIEVVFTSATSWWVFFLAISLVFVSALLWVFGRATVDYVSFFIWSVCSIAGISVESVKTIRGEEGLTRPLYATLTTELDQLINSAHTQSSSVVDASDFLEVTNYMVEILESDPQLRLMRRMSEPVEEIAETIQTEGASQLSLATVEKTRRRVERYYQNRLRVLQNSQLS